MRSTSYISEVRFLRLCEKCGKANEPTRKFCIRCGASLIKPSKPKTTSTPAKSQIPETEKVTVSTKEPTQAPLTKTASVTTDDKWVKPSEVSRNRVRVAGGSKKVSELDKARAAFAKAETVGIDEADGSGIVESRMLRASEVRELLEGPGSMTGSEDIPAPRMMEGSEQMPPEAESMIQPSIPTSSQIEESILGSKSGYVDRPKHAATPPPEVEDYQKDVRVQPEISADFTSSRYNQEEGTSEDAEGTEDFIWSSADESKTTENETKAIVDDAIDLVITCPDCGKTISVDMFEYPREVYSGMAAARMKQARFFIVQGKGDEALRVVRIANALYTKAGDKIGIQEIRKLIETLAKKV
jgi:hypothetical protein